MGFEPEYDGPFFDWPGYHPVTEEEKPYARHVRNKYAALLRMCDRSLGRILDKMDEYNLWEDTMLIVNTAVSYTHLDVYKRQTLCSVSSMRWTGMCRASAAW